MEHLSAYDNAPISPLATVATFDAFDLPTLRGAEPPGFHALNVGCPLTQALVQAARGVKRVHDAGILHRDIAARNFLVAADHTVKIADFGLAAPSNNAPFYTAQTPSALPLAYMAPESLQVGESLS